jgi:hypothetical protein
VSYRICVSAVARLTVAASLLFGSPAAYAGTVNYAFSGDFGPPAFSASVSLDVAGGQANSGTGTITFGANTFDLTLITLTTDGGNGNYGGQTGFRDNHGTDIFGGNTAIPIDANGLIFAISNDPKRGQDALFAAWNNGGGNFQFLISGTLAGAFDVYYLLANGNGNFAEAFNGPAATPLPAALPLFATGLAGLGLVARRRRKLAAA